MRPLALILLALAAIVMPARSVAGDSTERPRTYNVVLADGASPADFAQLHAIQPRHIVARVFPGFSARLTSAEAQRLATDPAVRGITPARTITADGVAAVLTGYPPALPTGVDRVD